MLKQLKSAFYYLKSSRTYRPVDAPRHGLRPVGKSEGQAVRGSLIACSLLRFASIATLPTLFTGFSQCGHHACPDTAENS